MNVERMSRWNADRLRYKGFLAGTAAVLLLAATGCGGSSARPGAAQAGTGGTSAATVGQPAATSAAATSPSATNAAATSTAPSAPAVAATVTSATPVKATGGGDFCKAVAASINKQATAAGGTKDDIAARIATVRAEELQAAQLAPASIRADVVTLFAASDAVWAALAKVNYDYSKLKPSDMSALSSPAVVAAEHRLTAYMTNTCGITAPGAPTTTG